MTTKLSESVVPYPSKMEKGDHEEEESTRGKGEATMD